MDIEGLKRATKDITSFSAKAILVYELTQVGGQLNSLQAADISTAPDSEQSIQIDTLQSSETISYNAQFLEIPAFNVTDPSTDAEQIAAQDTLSLWVKVSQQAASDNGFLPSDFESTVKSVTQNGKTYNVSETNLLKDVDVTVQDKSLVVKKNSLLVPYIANNGLSIAVMSDTDADGVETTVGSYIATIGDKSIAIPARFDADHNPISFMEFFTDANGVPQPREVSVSQAIINSDQSNIRDVQNPSLVIGQIEKGIQVTLVGTDEEAESVAGKGFGVLLAVTPDGKAFKIATSLVKRIDSAKPPIKEIPVNNTAVIPGLTLGEQDLTNPDIFNKVVEAGSFRTYLDQSKFIEGARLINFQIPTTFDAKASRKTLQYQTLTANYITLQKPILDPETKEIVATEPIDIILTMNDSSKKYCHSDSTWVVEMNNGVLKAAKQMGLIQTIDNAFKNGEAVSVFGINVHNYDGSCGPLYGYVLENWAAINQTDTKDVFQANMLAINSKQ